MTFREIDMADLAASSAKAHYRLLTATVVPRPIAWVSTRSPDGVDNLAPHSFFTVACASPPIVSVTSIGEKDTLRNVRASGEFIVHLAPEGLIEQVNRCGAGQPPEVSEFDDAGVERAPAAVVGAARVAASPVALECRLDRIVDLGTSSMILGEVVHAAVRDDVFAADRVDHPDVSALRPLARLGLDEWALPGEVVRLTRPSWDSTT